MRYIFALLLIANIPSIWCANILAVFVMPTYSHYILGHRLVEELARKGHQVTIISPYKQNHKIENYTEIYLEGLADMITEKKSTLLEFEDMLPINQVIETYRYGYAITEFTLNYKPVIDLLNANKTFDVVIMEQFVNEGLLGISFKVKAHLIYLATLGSNIWNNHIVSNPAPLSYIPNIHLNYKGNMNFFQRLHNFFMYAVEELYRRFIAYPYHDKLMHKAIPDAPKLDDLLYKQNSLVLLNSHISTNEPVPHVPNMIEIGGFHVRNQKLSPDLKKFLDEAVEGVIYFSMGTNVRSSVLPHEKRAEILKALGKLKQKVLWKWETDSLPDQPSNVKISKWFPQQAVLAHPNTRAFISHGGLLSITEVVYFGVPIIGIPIFADQKMNINAAVNSGFAVSVPYKELTEERLTKALHEILNNDTYRNNVQRKSSLMRDRQNHPLDEAVYWVEHVIRHNGSSHFRSAAMDMKWYEYEMIDVAVFLLLLACVMLLALTYLIKTVWGFGSAILADNIQVAKKEQ